MQSLALVAALAAAFATTTPPPVPPAPAVGRPVLTVPMERFGPKERPPRRYASWRVTRDVMYAFQYMDRLDVYVPDQPLDPAARPPARGWPCVVFVHGGGFRAGDKAEAEGFLELVRCGFALVAVNYRLSDSSSFPAPVHDCRDAVRFVRLQAVTYGMDPDAIGVMGTSAGGNLAAMVAVTADRPEFRAEDRAKGGSAAVRCACAWYAPLDFARIKDEARYRYRNDGPSFERSRPWSAYRQYFDGFLKGSRATWLAGSPIEYVNAGDPPFLLVHGEQDTMIPSRQSRFFAEALRKAAVPVELLMVPYAGHGFSSAELKRYRIMHSVLRFFDRQLRGGP